MAKRVKKEATVEVKAKIKAMEMEKKAEKAKSAPPAKEPIEFNQWWVKLQRIMKLPAWEKEIIWADMKARGLGMMELEEKYFKALELYGYKV